MNYPVWLDVPVIIAALLGLGVFFTLAVAVRSSDRSRLLRLVIRANVVAAAAIALSLAVDGLSGMVRALDALHMLGAVGWLLTMGYFTAMMGCPLMTAFALLMLDCPPASSAPRMPAPDTEYIEVLVPAWQFKEGR